MNRSPAARDLEDRLQSLADVLEDALVLHAPGRGADWAVRSLEALDRIGRASRCEEPEQQLPLIDEALGALRAARQAPAAEDAVTGILDDAIAFTTEVRARALDVATRTPSARGAPAAAPPVHASIGTPAVQHGIELQPPGLLPRESSFDPAADAATALANHGASAATVRRWLAEDDDAERTPPVHHATSLPEPRGAPLEIAQLERIGRDCLEDIAVLGGLRRHEDELGWSFAERFEERLLANLDALLALDRPRAPGGPRLGVARSLWRYLEEWNVPDPGRAFAFAFVLACSSEDSGPRWVAVTMRRAHPRLARAFEDAFALGSSPHIPAVLAATLDAETDRPRLLLALRSWRRHGHVDPVVMMPLTVHPDHEVAREAIRALGDDPSELAAAPLRELLSGEPICAAEAAVALARRGQREGPQHLRAVLAAADDAGALDGARAVAARTIALLGDPRDAAPLAAFCAQHPAEAELLGWHGHPAHATALLDGLGAEEEAARCASAWGLTRLLGWPERTPGARGAQGPIRDPAVWREHLARLEADRGKLDGGKRWQSARLAPGGAAAVARLAEELGAEGTLQRDRPRLRLELEISLGRPLPLDLEGWAVRQRAILDAVRAL